MACTHYFHNLYSFLRLHITLFFGSFCTVVPIYNLKQPAWLVTIIIIIILIWLCITTVFHCLSTFTTEFFVMY